MEIKVTDLDIVDINIKVAEQCLIKAGVEEDRERRIKSLIFANQSINQALKNFGVNISEVEINRGLPSDKKTNLQKQRKFN